MIIGRTNESPERSEGLSFGLQFIAITGWMNLGEACRAEVHPSVLTRAYRMEGGDDNSEGVIVTDWNEITRRGFFLSEG